MFKNVYTDLSPIEIFTNVSEHYEYAYLIEFADSKSRVARRCLIGFEPLKSIIVKDGECIVKSPEKEVRKRTADPLQTLREFVGQIRLEDVGLSFTGGAVGYVSYDLVRYLERLPQKTIDDCGFPDMEFGIYYDGLLFDKKDGRMHYYYLGEDRLDEVMHLLVKKPTQQLLSYTELRPNVKKDEFISMVETAKEYITAGDVFQVVLSKKYTFNVEGDVVAFYSLLRRLNPSPYMYILKMGERYIIGSSPEALVRVRGNLVETMPIAGTRPRGNDRALRKDLLSDPKELSEHMMLVDLARNDLGKISKFGSVRVSELKRVYKYSHVLHMVSRVVGELREGYDCYDALRAVFPAGTVTGAPKVRAMEIIEELEPTRRGPYAGSVGYVSFNGDSEFAIAIRTLFVNGGKAYIQAGAGIVADSQAENEWLETEHKLAPLIKALEMSSGDIR
ncbi:MAG: anthranilate synthase component I family protein [Nitrososphaerota archaeon]|nr:anthranilate synthase component I family protein [Aigarchaeota archaeon]MDW8076394.1 anthranilate synthase component I family protein [Nitrososphaerota archaeon]